jgi:hypothetical protein
MVADWQYGADRYRYVSMTKMTTAMNKDINENDEDE